MDLSIIIPVHNLENHILPLLVSLKLQVKSWKAELIFVCDNCTDKTKDIIETFDFSNTYEAIKVIECDVRSCGLGRNVGFKSAEGKYIWFMDGDDWLTSPYAITTVLMNVKKFGPVIQFDYEAPGFGAKGHPAMVWQYCYMLYSMSLPHAQHSFIKYLYCVMCCGYRVLSCSSMPSTSCSAISCRKR